MKKHVSLFEVDKGLKSMWKAKNELECTAIGENLYLLSFSSVELCNNIFENQPWNVRGSVLLLEHAAGDECLSELEMSLVPFWVHVHGLQLRAMNKVVGEAVGALFGRATMVECDEDDATIGKCIRLRVNPDVHKPLLR